MEKDRWMETYHCRMEKSMKEALLKKAAEEFRTANKIVEDALYIYMGLSEQERKRLVADGRKNFFS